MPVLRQARSVFFRVYEQKKGGVYLRALRKGKQSCDQQGGHSYVFDLRPSFGRNNGRLGHNKNHKQSYRYRGGCVSPVDIFTYLSKVRQV